MRKAGKGERPCPHSGPGGARGEHRKVDRQTDTGVEWTWLPVAAQPPEAHCGQEKSSVGSGQAPSAAVSRSCPPRGTEVPARVDAVGVGVVRLRLRGRPWLEGAAVDTLVAF